MKEYVRLTRRERFLIWTWHYELKPGLSFYKIAQKLNRSPSTIYDEVNKNRQRPDLPLKKFPYEPEFADFNATRNRIDRRRNHYKATKSDLRKIKKLIVEKSWSIPMIAKGSTIDLSKDTLYRYLHLGFNALADYDKKHYRKVKTRHIKAPRATKETAISEMVAARSIDKRPKRIERRRQFGHWEMDCIDSRKGVRAAVLVLVERKTRFTMTYPLRNKEHAEILNALKKFFLKYGKAIKSITTDRGSEFKNGTVMYELEQRGVPLYYAHPYQPEEKGTVERINRDFRKFYAKGTSFASITATDLRYRTNTINNYPRESIGWQTPRSKFKNLFDAIGRRQRAR